MGFSLSEYQIMELGCFSNKIQFLLNGEVIWQASDFPLSKELHDQIIIVVKTFPIRTRYCHLKTLRLSRNINNGEEENLLPCLYFLFTSSYTLCPFVVSFEPERWNIQSAHPITLFTHFKTNTKSINMYRLLRCCVLIKKSKHSESHEMGQANYRPQISINDEHSLYSISLTQSNPQ